MSIIKMTDVWKRFGFKWVLRGINWVVEKGDFWGIIGPGGSGKTVLVKLIAGLLRPERGEIYIKGSPIYKLGEISLQEIRKEIGMLFQNNALFMHLTVGENVAFPLKRLKNLQEDEIENRVKLALKEVGLLECINRYPNELSGGQQKRVGIARAIITEPSILIFDEPTAGLDPVTSKKIFNLIEREHTKKRGETTTIVISSDIKGVLSCVKKVAMVYKGEIIFQGDSKLLFEDTNPIVYQFVRGLTQGPY